MLLKKQVKESILPDSSNVTKYTFNVIAFFVKQVPNESILY